LDGKILSGLAGLGLSLLFSYVPGVKSWFDKLESDQKRGVVLLSLATIAVISYGLSCAGWWPQVTCDKAGIQTLIEAFVAALVTSQAAFLVSPKSKTGGSGQPPVGP